MKNRAPILFVLISLSVLVFMIVIFGYLNQINKLKSELSEIKCKYDNLVQKSNSTLLKDYQEAYNILREKEPKAFASFSKIMDSLDTR